MKQLTTGVIGMMVLYHIQIWKLWYIARHHLVLQCIVSGLNLLAALWSVQLMISLR